VASAMSGISAPTSKLQVLSAPLFYYGHAWGKSAIAAIYPSDAHSQLIFLETNYRV
jgi:hypothetical protein